MLHANCKNEHGSPSSLTYFAAFTTYQRVARVIPNWCFGPLGLSREVSMTILVHRAQTSDRLGIAVNFKASIHLPKANHSQQLHLFQLILTTGSGILIIVLWPSKRPGAIGAMNALDGPFSQQARSWPSAYARKVTFFGTSAMTEVRTRTS